MIELRLRHILGTSAVLALVGGGIWFFVEGTENSAVGTGGLPLIKADTNPVKLPPDDPGGEIMPNADSTVFTAMGADETHDPSMEGLKVPATPKPEGVSPDFAGLNTGFSVPQAPETKVESLFGGAVSSEPMERPAREAAEVAAANSAQDKGAYETGNALDMASDAPAKPAAPEPARTEQPKPAADTTPAPPAPTPIMNSATAAQDQEAQEKAATDTSPDAPAASAPPVPPSKPGADKKPSPAPNVAAVPAPKQPAPKDTASDAQKTVAQDVANEAYRHQSASAAKPGYYMQLASTPSKEEAPRLWTRLTKKYPAALAGLSPAYQTATVPGKGDYIRVQAGPLTQEQAAARCKQLRSVDPKGGCLVFKR